MSEIVGIDVSKNSLDFYFLQSSKSLRVGNDARSIEEIMGELAGVERLLLEATGGYERVAVETLRQAGLNVSAINPKRVRDFAKASGKLAKTDKIDAKVIAEFASIMPERNSLESCVFNEARQRLKDLNTRRQDIVKLLTMEKNRKYQAKEDAVSESILVLIKALESQLDCLEILLNACVKTDSTLAAQAKMLRKVKGVGPVLVWTLLSELSELGLINRKQIASLAGLAPFNCDSGYYRGQRHIWGGRQTVRNALYMAANTARQYEPEMKAFFEQLIQRGKPFKLALTACARKLLTQLNAKMREHYQEGSK